MKKVMVTSAVVLFMALSAAAQRTAPVAKIKDTVAEASPGLPTDNRKIYVGQDGQAATVTGHEAASINGGYAAIKKDTAPAAPAKPKNNKHF